MKRILFFNDSLAVGGTEKLLVDLLNHLTDKECEITLLLPEYREQDILLKDLSEKVYVRYLYTEKTSYLKRKIEENVMIFFPRVYAWMKGAKESNYDEIVCFKETFYARFLSVLKVPKVLWIHNIVYKRQYEIHSLKERLAVWLNKKHLNIVHQSYDLFDKVVCVSDSAKKAYMSVLHDGGILVQNVIVLYNAIDTMKVLEKAKESIDDFSRERTNFMLITRDSPEKRIDRLVNSAFRLKEEGYDFHVYVVGSGLDTDRMKSDLSSKGLNDMITILGHLENPYPYILQCDWSLCVSERESFSLSLLESMVLRIPVITTDCGGPRDVVDNGKYGMLVDNTGKAVYEGMKAVMDNPSFSDKYRENLHEAVARFDYGNWLQSVEKLLRI